MTRSHARVLALAALVWNVSCGGGDESAPMGSGLAGADTGGVGGKNTPPSASGGAGAIKTGGSANAGGGTNGAGGVNAGGAPSNGGSSGAAGASGSAAAGAAPDVPSPPVVSRYGRRWTRFATVNKNSETRSALLEVKAMATFRQAGVVPEGAVVLLEVGDANLETIEFIAYRVNVGGIWNAGLVFPDAYAMPDFSGAVNGLCEGCHANATSGTLYAMPSLLRFAVSSKLETFDCPMDSFNPCAADVYETGGQ